MGSFIKWYCKRIGKKKLTKADLEGPAYKTVKPFHTNNIILQFQMEECHRLLTDKIDLMNPEGHRVMPDVSKPLPSGGPPADYNEYKISEADFKNLHSKDFEDLYLLYLQGKLNHLPGFDKDASDFLFKEDYTIVSKPSVIYRDRSDQKKMMRMDEVQKFSNGTLTRVLDKLDHMVKDFRLFKYNPGIRSDTYTGNPVKEILLKLNLPDHRSVLTDSKVKVKMEMETLCSSGVNFITTCSYSFDKSKDFMKAQAYVSKLSQL
ncbi:hypothetical protein Tco_1144008 [Tanacetum coccineum]